METDVPPISSRPPTRLQLDPSRLQHANGYMSNCRHVAIFSFRTATARLSRCSHGGRPGRSALRPWSTARRRSAGGGMRRRPMQCQSPSRAVRAARSASAVQRHSQRPHRPACLRSECGRRTRHRDGRRRRTPRCARTSAEHRLRSSANQCCGECHTGSAESVACSAISSTANKWCLTEKVNRRKRVA